MPTVTSDDVGNPQNAGEYDVGGAFYQVDRRHIAAWSQNPMTAFRTIVCTRLGDPRNRFALGSAVDESA